MPAAKLNEYGLTDKQEAFIGAYVQNGGNGTKAAKTAGYSDTAAHTRAWEMLRMPKVLARMETLTRELMSDCAPACVRVLKELAVSAASETVRQAAASSLLDRTGYKVPLVVQIDDHRTQADVDKELATLLGLDPDSLSADQGADQADSDASATVTH